MTDNLDYICALSPTQAAMLAHTLHAPDSTVWRVQYVVTLAGDLDVDALERAWQVTVQRHAILRTAFYWTGIEKPLQVAYRTAQFRLRRHDAGDVRTLTEFARADRAKGFDLSRAPMMRISLIRLPCDRHALIWTFHHIILDGWSLGLVLRDTMAAYHAIRGGHEPPVTPSPPFREFVAWLQGQDLSDAEAYWRRTLRGFDAPTPLNAALECPSGLPDGEEVGKAELRLGAEVTERLAVMARAHRISLGAVVLAGWGVTIAARSRQDDVVFGVTMSGRPSTLPQVEERVGVFINTLPIRLRIPAQVPFSAWLETVQAQFAELQEYAHSPLERVHAWSGLPSSVALFHSHVVFENYPFNPVAVRYAPGVEISDAESIEQTNHPLTVIVVPGTEMQVRILYARKLLATDQVGHLLACYGSVLEGIAASPGRPVAQLMPGSELERDRVAGGLLAPRRPRSHESVPKEATR